MIVSSKPYPKISLLAGLLKKNQPSTFKSFEFHPLGREALIVGMKKMGLGNGDKVLLPAYICSSISNALIENGYKLIFIDIDANLNLPFSQVEAKVNEFDIKAILIVHYFGLKANARQIIKFCNKLNIKVIEDYSHSFLSKFDAINSDMSLYSMRKTLPIKDGGAFELKKNTRLDSKNLNNRLSYKVIETLMYVIFRTLEKIFTLIGFNIYSKKITKIKNLLLSKKISLRKIDLDNNKASLHLRLYLSDKRYLEDSRSKIVENFYYFSKEAQKKGLSLLINDIDDYSVPQGAILYDHNGELLEYLRSKGVGAWKWPAEEIPDEVIEQSNLYKNALRFNRELLILPIHQDLKKKHIDYMVRIIDNWLTKVKVS